MNITLRSKQSQQYPCSLQKPHVIEISCLIRFKVMVCPQTHHLFQLHTSHDEACKHTLRGVLQEPQLRLGLRGWIIDCYLPMVNGRSGSPRRHAQCSMQALVNVFHTTCMGKYNTPSWNNSENLFCILPGNQKVFGFYQIAISM